MLKGLDLTKPWHWFYLAMLFIATPIVAIVCVFTFFGPGWFLALFWWWIMGEIEPEEMQYAQSRPRKLSQKPVPRPVEQPTQPVAVPQHRHLWMKD